MSYTTHVIICYLMLACCSFFIVIPAHAFTANSLDITVDKNGDAIATFRFTLEGIIENAIPQSVLEEKLTQGLTTSSEPPQLKSMDRSSAILLMKKFADMSDVPTGTEYRTATMDFKKAEIALQNSGLGGAVSADFSPTTVTVTFPDTYKKEFSNVDVLPAIFHTIEDPVKVAQVQAAAEAQALAQAQGSSGATATPVPGSLSPKGSVNVTSSPPNIKVSIDSRYIGEAPAVFDDIAAGTHVMQFTKEGFESVSKNVTIIAGKTTNVMVVLKYVPAAATEDTSSFPWIPLLVVFIGLIAIGVGGYYYWSEKKKNEWGEKKPAAAPASRTHDPADRIIVPGETLVMPGDKVVVPPKKTVIIPKETVAEPKDTAVKLKKPAAVTPETKNSVVKVTMLKDFPDKGTGDEDCGNKGE